MLAILSNVFILLLTFTGSPPGAERVLDHLHLNAMAAELGAAGAASAGARRVRAARAH